jgi:phosphatidylethanolamine-binding protein (PEBP) family uncharacterized protein
MTIKLKSDSFADNTATPVEYAFYAPEARTHFAFAANRNSYVTWQNVPAEAKFTGSYSLNPEVKI